MTRKKPMSIFFKISANGYIYLCRLPVSKNISSNIIHKENFEFTDKLLIKEMYKSSGSRFYRLESTTQKAIYYMNATEFFHMVQNGSIDHGVVLGKWTFTKRGQRTTLKFLCSEK